ncbi:MAG: SsrA-binding protein SmpB [Proteobacteria bacterium]|nr:SsrA-binding protein SmpB [Pseudomonadota bacterium]
MNQRKKNKAKAAYICVNRRARHEYELGDTYEAGVVLVGTEVKSLRQGKADLTDAFARFIGDELFLIGLNITPYDKAARFNHEPKRDRKLLLSRNELTRLAVKMKERGFTLIPLEMHFAGSWVKVTLALARGRKQHDNRQAILETQQRREMRAVVRERKSR